MPNTPLPAHIRKGLGILVGIGTVAGVFFVGVYVGYANRPAVDKVTSVINKEPTEALASTSDAIPTDFAPFWRAWAIVDEKFVGGAQSSSPTDRVYGAIKGMMASFKDPYTTFFPPAENTAFETEIAGAFDGIGIEIGEKEGVLTVIAPLKDTPAYRAGVKSGDKIIKIDDTFTNDLGVEKAITLIRGKSGTDVKLTIVREGFQEPKVFSITRGHIELPTVSTEVHPEAQAFVIHLYNFSAQSATLFQNAFNEYLASGQPNLLIDLRGNPGGYLNAAVAIAGLFVPEGKTIVKEIGKTPQDVVVHTSRGPALFPKTAKLVILVDQGSASASEILAGALSEQGIGTLVGKKTFGKGSVQEVIKLTADTSLKITVAKWYTPKGISISDNGLTPEIEIPFVEDAQGVDIQLQKALAVFTR